MQGRMYGKDDKGEYYFGCPSCTFHNNLEATKCTVCD
jgi:hypothetical protein